MKIEQSIYTSEKNWEKKSDQNIESKAQLIFAFGSRTLLKNDTALSQLSKQYPNAQIVGCSTSGEIYKTQAIDNHIISTAVWFENSTLGVVKESIHDMENSYDVGAKLASKLNKTNLNHVMVFSEGLNINGSELTKGLNNELHNTVSITGGLAGDADLFNETVIIHNEEVLSNQVLAIGFYGNKLKVGYGSMGGWDSFGVDREVTKAKSNILYELDGQPALELYKRYLGSHAAHLPASALLFPLSLKLKDSNNSLVRTVLSVNEEDGSMIFAGDIPEGSIVRLMKSNFDSLVEGASGAAEMAKTSLDNMDADLAILISCVGRKLVLKHRIEDELEAITDVIGDKPAITGFYSYGEICPIKPFDQRCELHNQTMTITLFKEV